ncbi:MAG: AAA family ATPase [Burkholderiales bacterium]
MSTVPASERRQLTVMLCDLVGWTALSQRLDAEELAELVQAYRQRCTSIISSHGGAVAQYVGDAVLAYFGYPRAHEDDAERAMRAALAIAEAARSSPDGADANVHIGIATGMVVVGGVSRDGARFAPGGGDLSGDSISAVGSALNLAARLQALAGPGMIVVSDQTRRLAGAMFDYADLGLQHLKGFEAPVQAWQVVGEARVRSRFHALRASALTPLVDRRSELEALRQAWRSARGGEGKVLLLSSEPGVGKSRLAEVVATQIVDRRCLRLWYYCSPHLQSSPLAPLIRQLALAAGIAESDDQASKLQKLIDLIPKAVDDADDIVPLLADLLSIDYASRYPPLQMSPQRKKQRLFQGLMRVLETFASRRPVLLVVEDLHWIDPSSDELVGVLVDRLRGLPVLAILTARPEFEWHWHDTGQLLSMPLRPLERSDSIAMIELLCGGRHIPEVTITHIADQTDGLPLFIEDLTRDVLEELNQSGGGASVPRGRAASAVPTTLADALMARLDRLGAAKRVAQIGASIGREFPYEIIAKVADLPEEDLKEQLARLVESGLLVRLHSSLVLAHRFKHALVRDSAYSSLLKKEQITLHARIARTMLEVSPEVEEAQPELLAHHFEAAKEIDQAVHYLMKAAELSAKRSGFVEAVTQLERALSLLGAQPPSEARARRQLQVYLALGGVNAEYRGFSAGECGAAYNRALELCRELGDPPELFSVLSGAGSCEITRADFPRCRALAEECLARAARQQTKPPFVIGHRLLGGTLFLTGELAAARKHLEEAIAIYEQEPSLYRGTQALRVQDHKSTGLCYLALTLTCLGELERGVQAAESGLRHSEMLGDLHTINFSLCFLAAVLHFQRDTHDAMRRATESLELAREQGFATWIGISQMIRGAALISSGEREAGLREITAGISAHSGMEAGVYQPFGISLLVNGLIAVGRFDEALGALARAFAVCERTGERFYLAELWRLQGEALGQQGRLAEAEESLHTAIGIARQQEARLFEVRSAVSLCRLLGEPRNVAVLREKLEPVYKWFGEGARGRDVEDARALLALSNAGIVRM